jgi:hypothetical protein
MTTPASSCLLSGGPAVAPGRICVNLATLEVVSGSVDTDY